MDLGRLVAGVVEGADFLDGRLVHLEASRVIASVDGPKVERIVENLLANAAKYTPEESPIWVRVEAASPGVLLVVEDCGPGIPPELRERIFEPFRQGPNAQANRPGVGIGLSLVSSFAEIHGGRAWIEDRPAGGSSFHVLLVNGSATS
jgi:signal transduction histidine kinase